MTLGLCVHPLTHHEARREMRSVETGYGAVRVKLKFLEGETPLSATPEYEDCAALAKQHNLPVATVTDAAQRSAHEQFLGNANT